MKTVTRTPPQSCDSDLWQWAQKNQEERLAERISQVGRKISKDTHFSRKLMERIREILHKHLSAHRQKNF